jgi:hypothetical protein
MPPSSIAVPESVTVDDDRSHQAIGSFFLLEGSINPIFR